MGELGGRVERERNLGCGKQAGKKESWTSMCPVKPTIGQGKKKKGGSTEEWGGKRIREKS